MYRLNTLTLDHDGQKLKDKFYDDLIYQDNPLRGEREEDLEDVHKLNAEIESLKIKESFIHQQKKELSEDNRELYNLCNQIKDDIRAELRQKKKLKKQMQAGSPNTPSPTKPGKEEKEKTPGQLLFASLLKKKDGNQRRDAAEMSIVDQNAVDRNNTNIKAIPTVGRNPEGRVSKKLGDSKFEYNDEINSSDTEEY